MRWDAQQLAALLPLPMIPGHFPADQWQLGVYQTQHLAPSMGEMAQTMSVLSLDSKASQSSCCTCENR